MTEAVVAASPRAISSGWESVLALEAGSAVWAGYTTTDPRFVELTTVEAGEEDGVIERRALSRVLDVLETRR